MAGYIGPIPVPQATQSRETFTATASQTSFGTAGYQVGYLDVFMNGVKLAPADFTATNGSDVVLASGAAVNDIIEVVSYSAFEVLNQNFTGTTTVADLTVTGDLTVDGTTTTINSTTLNVDDINITVASGAADAAAANGAGLTVDGANATFNYASSGDKWTMNKNLDVTGTISPGGSGYFYLKNDSGNSKSVVRSESQPIVLQTYASSAWQDRLSIANNGVVSIVDSSGNEPTLQFTTATAMNYFYIARDSANGHTNFVSEETGSAIRFHTDPDGTGAKLRTEVTRWGDVKFYDDDGSTPSFTFDASDANITLTRNGTFAGTDNTQLNFFHYNDSGNPTAQIVVGGTTNYTGDMVFKSRGGGTSGGGGAAIYEYMRIRGNERELVINQDGLDHDFRVESDSNANMLLVDAGNNSVAINRSYGIAPLHVSGTASNTVSAANAFAKITDQGLDGLAIGSIQSSPFTAWLQSGYTANGYSPEMNNGYPLALNPLNANVVIGATNVADSSDGLSIVSASRDNLSIMYTGTEGGHTSSINFRDKRGATNARINNNLQDDGIGTAGAHLDFATAVNGALSQRLRIGGKNQTEAVFNDPGYDYDFRVESDSNANMLFVDAGLNTVQVGTTLTFGGPMNVEAGGIGMGESGASGYYRRIYWNAANNEMRFWNGTNEARISSGGSFVDASDESLKKDIADIDYGIDTVKSLQPRKYKMKDTGAEQVGFIAQEMEAQVPEVVSTGIAPNGDEQKGISYGQLTAVLTKALQEQQTIIETLEARITALENA